MEWGCLTSADSPFLMSFFRKIYRITADADTILWMQTLFRGHGRPRPRSVWYKPYDYATLVETTRLASSSY